MKKIGFNTVLVCSSLALCACGVTYHSPTVKGQAAGLEVQVVPITASSVRQANAAPYTPMSLPTAFHAVASGSGLKGDGPLPKPPLVAPQPHQTIVAKFPADTAPRQYQIGVGDVVQILSKNTAHPVGELGGVIAAQIQRQGYTVRDNGSISVPDIGQINVAGKTLEQAEDALFQSLVSRNIDPAFSLEILEYNSQHVAIGGNVARSGLVPITVTPLRLGAALAQVGGITSSSSETTAIRLYRDGKLYQIPAEDMRSSPKARDLLLLSGDAIFVDEGYDLERASLFYHHQITAIGLKRSARLNALAELDAELNLQRGALDEQRSTFTSRRDLGAEIRDYVYLAGEVSQQGRVALPYEQQASLADVLYNEGGFDTKTGDPAQIYVIRSGSDIGNTHVTAWHLDATNVVNIALATRMQMRPNDIVFIEEQTITKWSRAFEQAFPILINKSVNGDSSTP